LDSYLAPSTRPDFSRFINDPKPSFEYIKRREKSSTKKFEPKPTYLPSYQVRKKMPKVGKKKIYAKRPSPFEDFLERLIIYELTKDAEREQNLSDSSSVTSSSDSSSMTSSSAGSPQSPQSPQSSETSSSAPSTVSTNQGRPSVIVENVNYVVDII